MHNKLYDDITIFAKFLLTILIVVIFIMTKSIYLKLFVPILVIYLLLINSGKLKKYYRLIKNYLLIDIIIFVIIGLLLGFSLLLLYKYIIIMLLIKIFELELTFERTNTLIYKLIRHKYFSYRITLKLYYFNAIFMGKDEMIEFKKKSGTDNRIRHGLLSRLEYADYKTTRLDSNLKSNFYTVKNERTNLLSVILFVLFLIVLILVIVRK